MEKSVLELLKIIKGCNFVDILGLGKLLKVEEIDPFEDYITEICYSFSQKPRRERRKILKLMKQVSDTNQVIKEEKLNQEDRVN